jgi:hypothetical protein
MDTERFDSWVRTLATACTRRGAAMGLLGSGMSLVGLTVVEAKRHKKKHKKQPGGSLPVSCAVQPDFTPCGSGQQCSGGVCATPPNCGVAPDGCASALDCCGNVCDPLGRTCPLSDPGNPCRDARSCSGGAPCVGFVCQ